MTAQADENANLLARESSLADLGELAGPLTHEFNNLLNNLTLHLEIMKHKAPECLAEDLDQVRRQMVQTAGQITRFQRYRRMSGSSEESIDLNQVVRQSVALLLQSPPQQANGLPIIAQSHPAVEAGVVAVSAELQQDLPPVRGHGADLRRLCRFLLSNAVRAAAVRGGAVCIRTVRQGDLTQLLVEDNGPDAHAAALAHVFEPGHECREGMCCLEMAACRSIVRRLRGQIEARARPNGGLIVVFSIGQ